MGYFYNATISWWGFVEMIIIDLSVIKWKVHRRWWWCHIRRYYSNIFPMEWGRLWKSSDKVILSRVMNQVPSKLKSDNVTNKPDCSVRNESPYVLHTWLFYHITVVKCHIGCKRLFWTGCGHETPVFCLSCSHVLDTWIILSLKSKVCTNKYRWRNCEH